MHETGRATIAESSEVQDHGSFVTFLDELLADFRAGGRAGWENGTLDRFLDGLAAVARDAGRPQQLTWPEMAALLVAATGYE